jgi:hypothetical protein
MAKRKDLTANEHQDVKDYLLANWDRNRLKQGASRDATVKFSVTASCVSKIWRKMIAEHVNDPNNALWNVTSGKKRNYGCIKYGPVEFVNAVHALPLSNRTTIREMSC